MHVYTVKIKSFNSVFLHTMTITTKLIMELMFYAVK